MRKSVCEQRNVFEQSRNNIMCYLKYSMQGHTRIDLCSLVLKRN